jgi:hypothetical protein
MAKRLFQCLRGAMIVKLQGGLGNQLFQYAFGRTESLRRKEPLYFDTSLLDAGNPPRRYGLGDYNLEIEFATPDTKGEVFSGYWQSERYFNKDLIRKEFARPKDEPNVACREMAALIRFEPTCFIGVRRSDYLWPERLGFHGVLDKSYYDAAIKMLPPSTKFFIFTDDPEWCRENFDYEVVDVNGENEKHWDIWLMSLCRYAIIANSSFHWWGAWLGGDMVIAPWKWFVNQETEIIPARWTRL